MGNRGLKRRSASDGRDNVQVEKQRKNPFSGVSNAWIKPRSQSPNKKTEENQSNKLNIFMAPNIRSNENSIKNIPSQSNESQENNSPSFGRFDERVLNFDTKKSSIVSPELGKKGTKANEEFDDSKKIALTHEENQMNLKNEVLKLRTIYTSKQDKITPEHQISPLLKPFRGKRLNQKIATAADKRKELVLNTLKKNTNVFDLKLEKKNHEPNLNSKATDIFVQVEKYMDNRNREKKCF